jgi:hypothetical protein
MGPEGRRLIHGVPCRHGWHRIASMGAETSGAGGSGWGGAGCGPGVALSAADGLWASHGRLAGTPAILIHPGGRQRIRGKTHSQPAALAVSVAINIGQSYGDRARLVTVAAPASPVSTTCTVLWWTGAGTGSEFGAIMMGT